MSDGDDQLNDIMLWENVRDNVKLATSRLVANIQKEIVADTSLREFFDKPQLNGVMFQRAQVWMNRVYWICCSVQIAGGGDVTPEFNLAMWEYWLYPFMFDNEGASTADRRKTSQLLALLFEASGFLRDRENGGGRVSQKDACMSVRAKLYTSLQSTIGGITFQPSQVSEKDYSVVKEFGYSILGVEPPEQPISSILARRIILTPETHPEVQIEQQLPEVIHPSQVVTSLQSSGVQPSLHYPNRISAESWSNLEIVFLEEFKVEIRCGNLKEVRSYEEWGPGRFGFRDERTEKPNLAWEFFLLFAKQNGVISDIDKVRRVFPTLYSKTGRNPWELVEKRVESIRRVLRQRFDIPGDPIPYASNGGYKAKLKLRLGENFNS